MSYIDPTHKVYAHVEQLATLKAGGKPAPVTVEWDLSNRCDRACTFASGACHFAYTHTRGPLKGTQAKPLLAIAGGDLADIDLVGRTLNQLAEAGTKAIVWTGGGEPTLHPYFGHIVCATAAFLFDQGLYTHGGHITDDLAHILKSNLSWVVVSLDATNAKDYQRIKGGPIGWYDEVLLGITRLTSASGPCKVGVSFLLDESNWGQAIQMAQLARELRADYSTFRPVINYEMSDPAAPPKHTEWVAEFLRTYGIRLSGMSDVEFLPSRFEQYANWKRKRPYDACHGIALNTTITPDGKVWVCPNRREFADSLLGDLSKESFAEIWARHPGEWTDFRQCRVMCRLHFLNMALKPVFEPGPHVNFV